MPEPIIEEYAGGIQITFLKNGKVGERVGEKVGEKVGESITVNQEKIIKQIRLNKYISARELSNELGISQRKTEENISKLKQKGIIKRIGPAKGGHWEITNKPEIIVL